MAKVKIVQSGSLFPNPHEQFLEGFTDFGEVHPDNLREAFRAPDAEKTLSEREKEAESRIARFLPPFVNRSSVALNDILRATAKSYTKWVGDKLLELRKVFVGGILSEVPDQQGTGDGLRNLQQFADEYRVLRGRYESERQLVELIRNHRAIHLLRGTLNGPAGRAKSSTESGTPRNFGLVYDLTRITRGHVEYRILDDAIPGGEKASWFLDITYPDFNEEGNYAPEQPLRFLDISSILLIKAVNNNNRFFVEVNVNDHNWYLDYTFPDGVIEFDSDDSEFRYNPEESNLFLDVAGLFRYIRRNHDGYYTKDEILRIIYEDLVPAWVHFQVVWYPPTDPAVVHGPTDTFFVA